MSHDTQQHLRELEEIHALMSTARNRLRNFAALHPHISDLEVVPTKGLMTCGIVTILSLHKRLRNSIEEENETLRSGGPSQGSPQDHNVAPPP